MSNARKLADNLPSEGQLGNRNMLVNGAMQIYQRGAGTYTNNNFALDRWKYAINGNDEAAGTITQVADAPSGFATSLKLTTTTAESAWAANEYSHISQLVEAQNLQSLAYGSSAAKQVTLSFYVKSSVTGTFAVGLYKPDNTAQIHNKTYTINSANTWEYKTLTFAANTTAGGVINNDNGIGFYVNWHLAAGSTYTGGGSLTDWNNYGGSSFWANGQATNALFTTNGSTWQLTGCQLEIGDTATNFEHRSAGDMLQACERYFQTYSNRTWNGINEHAANYKMFVNGVFRQKMRATPTGSFVGTVNIARPQVGVTQRPNAFQGLSPEGFYMFRWPSSGTYGGSLGTHGDAYYYCIVQEGPKNRIDFVSEL